MEKEEKIDKLFNQINQQMTINELDKKHNFKSIITFYCPTWSKKE